MFVGNAYEFCALPPPVDAENLESLPGSVATLLATFGATPNN
jgi:hypothetical protein